MSFPRPLSDRANNWWRRYAVGVAAATLGVFMACTELYVVTR